MVARVTIAKCFGLTVPHKTGIVSAAILVACLATVQSLGQQADSVVQKVELAKVAAQNKIENLPAVNGDSLQVKMKLDSVSGKLNNSIDSLSRLQLPQDEYYEKLDNLLKSTQVKVKEKISLGSDSLNEKSNELVRKYQDKLESKRQRLDSLNLKHKLDLSLGKADVNPDFSPGDFKMAEVGSPAFDKPETPGVNLPGTNVPGIEIPGAQSVTNKLESVTDAAGKAGEYAEKTANLKNIDVKEEAKKLPGELEQQVEKIDALEGVNKELAQGDKIKSQVENIESQVVSPPDVQSEVKKRSRQELGNHMAGKEEAINQGLKQMEKLQRKYDRVPDIRKLPEKKPNNMAGKPFIERITPGLQFQVSNIDTQWKGVDLAPSFEYWFHHKFRAGVGASYRINVNTKSFHTTDQDRVYGFRVFARYKLPKGFFAHLEGEAFRTNESLVNGFNSGDPDFRVWDKAINTGIFKSYRINKYTRGTMLFLYDLTTIDETLNISQLAFRFGVEFKLKKKKEADQKKEAM